jgi:protoporphyrinogen oxidase
MNAARRSGLKREMFGCVRGGYRVIIDQLVKHLQDIGVELQENTRISHVHTLEEKCRIVLNEGTQREYDQVVCTLPSPLVPSICPQLSDTEKERWKKISYRGIICASLLLQSPLSPYYITNITESWSPFTGVIEMTALLRPSYFGGRSLVYLPKYLSPNDRMFEESDESVREYFLTGIKRMYPEFDESAILSFQIARAKYVYAVSTLNYSNSLPPMETSIAGLYVINSSHIINGTLNVDETVALAERGAQMLMSSQEVHTPRVVKV